MYFLLISVLQLTTGLSPTNEYSTVVPLVGVVAVSMAKEGLEDWQRHTDDARQNNRTCQVLRHRTGGQSGGSGPRQPPARTPPESANNVQTETSRPSRGRIGWSRTQWQHVQPGDVLLLRSGEEVPCDCVLLSSSHARSGVVYVSTSQLDGESALKPREVPDTGLDLGKSASQLARVRGHASCDPPSLGLSDFSGQLHLLQVSRSRRGRRSMQRQGNENDKASADPAPRSPSSSVPLELPSGPSVGTEAWAAPADRSGDSRGAMQPAHSAGVERGRSKSQSGSDTNSSLGSTSELHSQLPRPGLDGEEGRGQGREGWDAPCGSGSVSTAATSFRADNTLLRGSTIRNTKWCVALAVFTGANTKLALNSSDAPSKRSKLDRVVDQAVVIVFICLLGLVLLCGSTSRTWSVANAGAASYLPFLRESNTTSSRVGQLVTFLILLNNLVPISLSVTLELVKWCQARRIESLEGDRRRNLREAVAAARKAKAATDVTKQARGRRCYQTKSEDSEQAAGLTAEPCVVARTSNLSEDLGCVTHVLCDKTGTLTENRMQLVACCVGDTVYGEWGRAGSAMPKPSPVESVGPPLRAHQAPSKPRDQVLRCEAVSFRSEALVSALTAAGHGGNGKSGAASAARGSSLGEREADFMRALSLCSTVLPAAGDLDGNRGDGDSTPGLDLTESQSPSRTQSGMHATARPESSASEFHAVQDGRMGDVLDGDPALWYQGTSPDEVALAVAARVMGVGMVGRKGRGIRLDCSGLGHEDVDLLGDTGNSSGEVADMTLERQSEDSTPLPRHVFAMGHRQRHSSHENWEILAMNAFSSSRARMSVLLRGPTGRLLLLAKGSDTKMFRRAKRDTASARGRLHRIRERVNAFATAGLRTLVVAKRELGEEEAADWVRAHKRASGLHGPARDAQLDAAAEYIEKDLELLGAAAIEDRLQDGVPRTIERLRRAGCRVWVLTGDKQQTAVSVSLASRLLSPGMKRFVIDGDSFEECWEQLSQARAELRSLKMWAPGKLVQGLAVVLEGKALRCLLHPSPTELTADGQPPLEGDKGDGGPGTAASIPVVLSPQLDLSRRKRVRVKSKSHPAPSPVQQHSDRRPTSVQAGLELQSVRSDGASVKGGESGQDVYGSGASAATAGPQLDESTPALAARLPTDASISSSIPEMPTDRLQPDLGLDIGEGGSVTETSPRRPMGAWVDEMEVSSVGSGSEASTAVPSIVTSVSGGFGSSKLDETNSPCECGPAGDPACWCLYSCACSGEGLAGSAAHGSLLSCSVGRLGCALCPVCTGTPEMNRPNPKRGPLAGTAAASSMRAAKGLPGPGTVARAAMQRCCPASLRDIDSNYQGAQQQSTLLGSGSENGDEVAGTDDEAGALHAPLMDLLEQCEAVVACRLTPAQKAWLTQRVRNRDPNSTCVAVGDGGNDVGMIQAAHIGVGISGKEGRQAVNASDFAITGFRLLERLILVHGRQNYRRVSLVVLYSFYKNFVLVFTLLLFSFENGSSGTTLFESFLGTGWNVAFTAFPIIAAGVLDEDLLAQLVPYAPEVYRPRTSGEVFSASRLLGWAANGVWHACAAYLVARLTLMRHTAPQGHAGSLLFDGTGINMAIVAVVSIKLLQEVRSISMPLVLSVILSVFLWLLFLLVYQNMHQLTGMDAFRDFEGIGSRVLATPHVWLSAVTTVGLTWTVDVAIAAWQRQQFPTLAQVVEECVIHGDAITLEEKAGRSRRRLIAEEDQPVNSASGLGISRVGSAHEISAQSAGFPRQSQASDGSTGRDSVGIEDGGEFEFDDEPIPLTIAVVGNTTRRDSMLPELPNDGAGERNQAHRQEMNLLRALTGAAKHELKQVQWLQQMLLSEHGVPRSVRATAMELSVVDRASVMVCTRLGIKNTQKLVGAASEAALLPPSMPATASTGELRGSSQRHKSGGGSRMGSQQPLEENQSRQLARAHSSIDVSKLVGASGRDQESTPAAAALTMAWVQNSGLELLYQSTYWIPKAVVISRIALISICVLASGYIVLELSAPNEFNATTIGVRVSLLVLGCLLAGFSFFRQFEQWYTTIVMVATLAGTIGTSLVISDTGVFGQTLFQLGVFLVIRLPFLGQLCASTVGLIVWIAIASSQSVSTSYVAEGGNAGAVFETVLYLGFVIGFSAVGARNLHEAMRGDFLEQRRLKKEKRAFQTVLGSMLPTHVIAKLEEQSAGLKVWGGLYWEHEPDVTVVFCDISGFDSALDQRSPYHLVQLLDRVYTLLDAICEKHGVTKMETVGKTWMGCAGLHGQRGNNAARAVFFGLDVLNAVSRLRDQEGRQIVKFRIGVNTGEAVAGVVGLKKPQFCLFGDTVNTASRMQSSGEAGKVHISGSTHTAIADLFQFTEREIEVKSKGRLTTYFVGRPLIGERLPPPLSGRSTDIELHEIAGSQNASSPIGEDGCFARLAGTGWGCCQPTPDTSDTGAAFDQEESLTASLYDVIFGFDNRRQEARFQLEVASGSRAAAARSFAFVCLFHVFRLLDALFLSVNERQSLKYVGFRAGGLAVSAAMFLLLRVQSRSQSKPTRAGSSGLKLLIACSLLLLAVTTSAAESLAWRAGLDLIYLFAVASHGGLLGFVESLGVNVFSAFILFVISGGIARAQYREPAGDPLDLTVAFFCMAGLAMTAIAACAEEVYVRRRFCKRLETRQETQRIHSILFKMLPRQIVEQLKEGRRTHGQLYSNVTLLFMDIAGFTKMSQAIAPSQVVQLLNSLFSDYDRLTAKHGAFKVQTIGDAYVACAGLPYADAEVDVDFLDDEDDGSSGSTSSLQRLEDEIDDDSNSSSGLASGTIKAVASIGSSTLQSRHYSNEELDRVTDSLLGRGARMRYRFASRRSVRRQTVAETVGKPTTRDLALSMLTLAQEMHKCSNRIKNPATGRSIQVRIGLHTGTIVGGVIGTKTLRFDIWGPHVIAGNAMESNGVPGQTVVSNYTRRAIGRADDTIRFEPHKDVTVTGLGTLETFVARRAVRRATSKQHG